MTALHAEYRLSSPSSLPEGVAFDPKTRRFFATGLFGGQVTAIDGQTGAEEVVFTCTSEPSQLSGAKVDAQARRLWVCGSDIRSSRGGVYLFDADSLALLRYFELSRSGICNDVCLDTNGVAYVTDSFQPVIYRVDPRDGSHGEFVRDPRMSADIGRFGLNGITVTPDGKFLIGGFSTPSKLFAIALDDPSNPREISLTGDPFAPENDPHYTGADGIIFIDDALYVIHDGGVQQVRFSAADFSSGHVVGALAPESGLTTATVADGELYVIKSDVLRTLHMRQAPNLPFKIYRFPRELFVQPR